MNSAFHFLTQSYHAKSTPNLLILRIELHNFQADSGSDLKYRSVPGMYGARLGCLCCVLFGVENVIP